MQSQWRDQDADDLVAHYAKQGVAEDLALRVYTTRLLGRDPALVLHGGGNTSVKTKMTDFIGDAVEVLCIKGSGWDMGEIEPAGLPAVRLEPLRRLRELDTLNDFDMVNVQRGNLLDATAPNPSVETLLHAFLPHRYIDHTHASAVLSLCDQPDGAEICQRVYGDRVGLVPYIMPGFALAKAAAEVFERNQAVEGLILLQHGVFSFGATAREAYERMIALVSRAENHLAEAASKGKSYRSIALPANPAALAAIAPIIRGACARPNATVPGDFHRMILDFRGGDDIRAFVDSEDLQRYGNAGVVTPDHNIRIKNWPLILPPVAAGQLDSFAEVTRAATAGFIDRYTRYFETHNQRHDGSKTMLDPMPRVALVPGLGLFGMGRNAKDAAVNADLAESAAKTIIAAETIGRFTSISEADHFDIEYWALEQAKLGQGKAPPLQGQVVAITGGAGAIGAATARAFATLGAQIAILDNAAGQAEILVRELGPGHLALACDVTNKTQIAKAFTAICEKFGGLDILVSNAGAAWQGRIGDVTDAVLRRSFELNFFAHQNVAQAAVKIMRAQGTGGCLLFNTSKQAVNPGADFGPYGLPKAATLFLVRQYALDHGHEGIRANAVNADRIRSGLLDDDMIAARAEARGLNEASYMAGNLLRREVTAADVAQAFVHQALALNTTANVTTVDGGNIAAALR